MSRSLTLYHLSEEYRNLFAQLYDPETGEIKKEVEAKIEALLPSVENKCISVANWIKKLESEQREITFMKNQIHEREEAYNKEVNKWQEYLIQNMEKNNMSKISCPYFTIQLKKNPYSANVYDEFQLPSKFIKTVETKKVEMKPDKLAIIDEFVKTGNEIPGVTVCKKTKLVLSVEKV